VCALQTHAPLTYNVARILKQSSTLLHCGVRVLRETERGHCSAPNAAHHHYCVCEIVAACRVYISSDC
jgi:hypothetical protein